jgi:hypothetical protein
MFKEYNPNYFNIDMNIVMDELKMIFEQLPLEILVGIGSGVNTLEFTSEPDRVAQSVFRLRVEFNKENKSLNIPNLLIPSKMQKRGIGKKIITALLNGAIKNEYDLFLIEIINKGWFDSLIKYGGQRCVNPENIYIPPTWSYSDIKSSK